MPFERRVVGAEPEIDDESFELPDELARLGDLLSRQAQQLAETYPAHPLEGTAADDSPQAAPVEALEAALEPQAPRTFPWWLLTRVAAVVLVAVSVVWIARSGQDRSAGESMGELPRPAARATGDVPHRIGAPVYAISAPEPALEAVSNPVRLLFDSFDVNSTNQPTGWEDVLPKCGTGPESEGLLDLWEEQNPPRITISM